MKIKQKLILSYLAISLLGTIASLLGIQNMNRVHAGFDRIAEQTIPVKNELSELERSINNIIRCTNQFVSLNQNRDLFEQSKSENESAESIETELQDEINELKLDEQNYQESLAKYKSLINLYFPKERKYLERIEKSSHKIINLSKEIFNSREKTELQIFLKQREIDQSRESFSAAVQDALKNESLELEERKSSLHSKLKVAVQEIFIFSIFNVFLAIILGAFASFSISRPIEKLKNAAVEIGKGKLAVRTDFSSKDELGILVQTFNKMAEDLQQYFADIQQSKEYSSLLATALENVTDAIEITDSKAKYLYVNPAFEKITGYSQQEVLGKTPALLRSGKHDLDFYQEIFDTVTGKQIWQGCLISKRKDGTLYDQEVTLSPILNEQSLLTHIVAVKRDITERKQAEEALQASEERFRVLVTYAPVGIFQTDTQGDCLFVNPRWLAITDLSRQDAMGVGWVNALHPDDREQVLANWYNAAKTGDEFSMEYRFRTPDGRTVWVFGRAVAIRDRNHQIVGYFSTITDITDRRRIEATLREAERRWRTLLENVRLVVVGLNRLGNVEYVNPFFLELSGYTQAEVIGKNWFENFLPSAQRQPVKTCFLDTLEQNLYPHYQNPILTKSGEERMISWNNTLLQTPQGEIIGTMSIGEDITERQAIERMKDEFISVVSHELRTPLAAIQGGLSLLTSGLMTAQSDRGHRVIEIAAESVDRLVLLVNDILELERLELGKIRLSKQPCNAAELMLKARHQVQVMAKRAGIALSVTPQTIAFQADPDRIIQVLTNLLGNAIKFSARDSTVYFNVALQEASVLFAVKDQGRGIPTENLDSIFERFHQVDASDSRKKGGTGLGLAICQSIVQQHGGQIWAESVLGEGSSFFFTLPRIITEDESNDNQENLGD
jgi:PAS domain S-box-containing protein